jgi:predicted transcriptional regulator
VNGAKSPLTQPNILFDSKGSEYLVPNVRGQKITSLNINSLLKHMDQLGVCMYKQQVDILAINETKLDTEQYSRRYSIRIYGLSQAPGLVQEGVDGVVPKKIVLKQQLFFAKMNWA